MVTTARLHGLGERARDTLGDTTLVPTKSPKKGLCTVRSIQSNRTYRVSKIKINGLDHPGLYLSQPDTLKITCKFIISMDLNAVIVYEFPCIQYAVYGV